MEINLNKQPAIAPASFGMSACGHATLVVRARGAVVKGDMGIATAYAPGTSAWRPPSS